jgi:hypothetical protein
VTEQDLIVFFAIGFCCGATVALIAASIAASALLKRKAARNDH